MAVQEQLPRQFGRFTLHERIGAGGMGVVYRATMQGLAGLEKPVAVKCILPHLVEDGSDFVNELIAEAKLSVLMSHPNIIQVYDLDQVDNQIYISMEYVPGSSLASVMRTAMQQPRPLSIPAVVSVAVQVARGLHYAHNLRDPTTKQPLRVVHRDVSPSNVIIGASGVVKIIDFGIARAATRLSMTAPGLVKGKLTYMAPEQVTAAEIDHRVDIFAVGVILFEMLTLRRLYGHTSNLVGEVLAAEIPSMRRLRPDLPVDLEAVVGKTLSRDPDDRYATADELAKALIAVQPPLEGPALLNRLLGRRDSWNEVSEGKLPLPPPNQPQPSEAPTRAEPSGALASHPAAAQPAAASSPTAAPVRGRRWLVPVLTTALLLAAVLTVVLLYQWRTRPTPPLPAATPPPTALPAAPADAVRASPDAGVVREEAAAAPAPDPDGQRAKPPRGPRRSPARDATAAATKPLEAREVETALMRERRKLQACLEKHFKPGGHSGPVVLSLRVVSDGSVSQATLGPEAVAGTPLAKCMTGVARRVRVRPHSDDFVEISFPFEINVETSN